VPFCKWILSVNVRPIFLIVIFTHCF
jgi:hypothetical protein